MFTDAFPIISTPDMERALGFYRDLLGGTVDFRFPEEGEPRYVSLRIGEAQIGIGYVPDAVRGAGGQRSHSGSTPTAATRQSSDSGQRVLRSPRSRRISLGVSGCRGPSIPTATR